MAIDLEEVPNVAPGAGQVLPPTGAPPAQLTPEDAIALESVPGINRGALANLQTNVADRQPMAPQPQTPQPQQPAPPPVNPLGVAGYVPGTSSSTTSSVQLSKEGKEAAKKADEAAAAEIDAARRQAAVTQEKSAIQAEQARTQATMAQDAVTQAQTDQAQRAELGKQHLDKISAAISDFKSAKIDPDHWWNSRTTGQKIAATLGTALDVMGAAWSRSGRTPTADAIQHAIDRDIEGQKMAMDAKARGVQMATTAYSAAREAGADDALAKATVRVASLDKVQKDFTAQLAEKTLGPEQKAAADQLLAQMEQRRQNAALQVAQLTAKHVSSTSSRTPVTNAQMSAMGQAAQPANIPGAHVQDPQAAFQATAHPESAQKVRDTTAAWNTAIQATHRMAQIRKEVGTEVWDTDKINEYEAEANAGIGALTKMANSGTLNAGEFERYKPFFQSLGPHLSDARRLVGGGDSVLKGLEGFEKAARRSANAALTPYGYGFGDQNNTATVVARRAGYALMSDGSVRKDAQ